MDGSHQVSIPNRFAADAVFVASSENWAREKHKLPKAGLLLERLSKTPKEVSFWYNRWP